MQKIRNFVYAHQSPTAPFNTMGITTAKSEKVENSSFKQIYSFVYTHIPPKYRKGLDQSILFYKKII